MFHNNLTSVNKLKNHTVVYNESNIDIGKLTTWYKGFPRGQTYIAKPFTSRVQESEDKWQKKNNDSVKTL